MLSIYGLIERVMVENYQQEYEFTISECFERVSEAPQLKLYRQKFVI